MEDTKKIRERLNHILGEVVGLKKDLITLGLKDKNRADEAWADLFTAIPEVTRLWRGPGAVSEIRNQREK